VIASEIMLPPHAPEIYLDRATLWNAVENCEKHPKAQLAYSFDIAMQNELTLEENMELARKFVQEQFVTKGMIADLAFHSPEKEDGGIPNPHFHVMTTMRPLNPDGTWGQKQRREYLLDEDGNRIRDKNGDYMFNAVHTTDWHEPETLEHWREQWAAAVNTKFEEKGLDVRIDHRSYVRQGLDLIPTVHEGANVRQMEAKGIRTEKGELNRWIKATNRLMQDVRKKIKALFVWMAEVKEELSKPQTPSLADLLIAYYNQRNAGAWSNKARTGNLKQFAEAVNYLTENKLLTLEDLQERLSSVNEEFEALSDSMKKKSARIKELQELIREGENYQRLKPVHTELNNIKFKKQREKFETSHDAELRLFYAARRILKEKLDGKPIALKAWKQEYAQLKTEYAELSPQHKPLREEVIRLRQGQNAGDTALRRGGRGCLFGSAAAGAAVFGLDARFVFPGEERVHREIDLAEDLAGAFRARAAHRRAGLRRNAVVERRDEQLRVAFEPDDGELSNRDKQALAFAGQHQRLVEAAQQRLRDGGRGFALAAAAARLHHARAEDDRVDRLRNGPRQRDGLQRLLTKARQIVPAGENACARFPAEQNQPLGEHGKARDGIRASGRERRVGNDAVIERYVDRKIAGGVGNRLHLYLSKEQLHIPRLCACRAVERLLGVDR